MLASEEDIHVTTEAGSVREAIDEADRTRPDVVVMDVRLTDGSGIEATREIRAKHPPPTCPDVDLVRGRRGLVRIDRGRRVGVRPEAGPVR